VWLRGAAGVGGEVSEETIQTYLYSNCTFFHQIEQRVQSSFTVHCTCFCQPAGKQDRIHARTNMVKTALRKLFAGILCGCLVLLVLLIGGQVNAGKKPSNHIQPYFSCTVEQARFRKKKALYRTFWSLSLSLSQPYFNRASSQPEFTKRQASSYRGNFGHYNLLYLLASS